MSSEEENKALVRRFYAEMESVRLEDVTDEGDGVVRATVVFDRRVR